MKITRSAMLITAILLCALPLAAQQKLALSITTASFGEEPTGKPVQVAWVNKMSEVMGKPLDLNIQYIHQQDFGEKLKIMIASGDLPDIITNMGLSQDEVFKYGQSGMFVDLSKYMDQLPNYKKALDAAKSSMSSLTTPAGNLYGFYAVTYNVLKVDGGNDLEYTAGIRTDLFEANKIAIPKTIEDLYQAAKKLKAVYPKKYPLFQMEQWQNPIKILLAANRVGEGKYYDGKEFKYGPLQDGYKDALIEMNRWYKEGLISPDYFTQTQANGNATMAAADGMIVPAMWYGYPSVWEGQYPAQKWTMVAGLKNPKYGEPFVFNKVTYDDVSIAPWWCVLINAKSKVPVAELLKFMDAQFSPAVIDLQAWGILGETYTVDAKGVKHFTAKVLKDPSGVAQSYGFGNGNSRPGIFPEAQDGLANAEGVMLQNNVVNGKAIRAKYTDIKRDFYVDAQTIPETKIKVLPLTSSETETYAEIMTPIETYAKAQAAKFIQGGRPFSEWNKYLAELKGMGDIQKAMSIYNSKVAKK